MSEQAGPSAQTQEGLFDRLVAGLGATRDRDPEAAFQRRFLVGCGAIGLGVTAVSIGQALSQEQSTLVWLLAGFGLAVIAVALLLRVGINLQVMIWANLGLLAVFFFLASIQTEAFHPEQLGWLVLIPLVAALAARPREQNLAGAPARFPLTVPAAFALSLGVGAAIVVANQQGWTLHQKAVATPWGAFGDFAPLLFGVSAIVMLFERLLRRVVEENRVLRGLLPVCAWCHQIRGADGSWQQVDRYLQDRGASITHVICPPCVAKHYPEQP